MKILIITKNVGKTAPGIVFERLLFGLSSCHDVDLIVSDYAPSIDLSNIKKIIKITNPILSGKLLKIFMIIFKVNPINFIWALRAKRRILKEREKYDLVLGLVSFGHYEGLIAGSVISKLLKTKLAVYTVDAIPAPTSWMPEDLFYIALKKMIKKYLSKADALFSSNREMLNYQINIVSSKKKIFSGVIFTPAFGSFQVLPVKSNTDKNIFLYTGGIYGARNPEYLLEGFNKLLKKYPESQLIFVGSSLPNKTLNKFSEEVIDKILFLPFTVDLVPYYSMATALLDIDSDVENDIFLSSKIMNYLMVDRIIISETGFNSPSRHLFKNIDSILQCSHNQDAICDAMEKAILIKNNVNYEGRFPLIKLFQLENVIDNLNADLEKLLSNKI
ncbi:glycosyltransferase family protein [Chryseobacterium indoltheticum]|uniref:Glycosyltransferase involved in cell wall bisynthesis n=1 Tax=Chryseobacterium indoltheticum TaxID=254 RepID=A0A381F5F6_9FLAO|nr:hypothetical protein [Chryseobacterium indoltheticum]AZA75233.1 hypothetical protein EG358_16335 [Chryseobacterium indoltheticum]SIR15316.1 Glycosyltransferase involved in cell wall bisynthesis [Chryseobacterium indoltheticum]SUX41727.1 Uncharacterised protein [Chryseobacterium indoltheticum]